MARRGDGLYLRGKTWYLDFRYDGTRHVVRLGRNINRTAASEIATVKRGAILKGEAGIGRRKKDLPLKEAVDYFIEWAERNRKWRTVYDYKKCKRQVLAAFSDKRLSQIGTKDLEKYKERRFQGGARVRPNRELAFLKRVYYWCAEQDPALYEGENPVTKVEFLNEPEGPTRFLETEEDTKLLPALPPHVQAMVLLCEYTGLRWNAELLSLKWDDVDLKHRQLSVIPAWSKNHERRVVSLNGPAVGLLAQLKATRRGAYVFCKKNGEPYAKTPRAFRKTCKELGLADVTPHTLRHTFASRMIMSGTDPETLRQLAGWKTVGMIKRYVHLNDSHKAAAVERMAEHFPTLFTTADPDIANSA